MPERKAAKKTTKTAARRTTRKSSSFLTAEEKAAMKATLEERRAQSRNMSKAEDEAAVLAKIAEMGPHDRAMAKRIHEIVKVNAPGLSAKTWYGMPAYARDGKIFCFFQAASKFKSKYATLGFIHDNANLDDGNMWPSGFSLKELTAAEESKIAALVKKSVR